MIRKTFLLTGLLVPLCFQAQTKLLTLEDASGLNRAIYPERLNQLQWRGEGSCFAFVKDNYLLSEGLDPGNQDTLLTLEDLNARLARHITDTLSRFPSVTFSSKSKFWFEQKGNIFRFDLDTRMTELVNSFSPGGSNVEIDPESLNVAFTKDNNIFVAIGGEERQVTFDGKPGLVYGTSVHRNEFGIHKGLFWSPGGRRLAFYRMDETMVTDYPLVNIDSRIAGLQNTKYPMAGMASHEVTVGIYNPVKDTTVYLATEVPSDWYLTNLTWSPDEKYVCIVVLNRDQNHLWVNLYDAIHGGLVRTLFEETSDSYVEPQHGLFFLQDDPQRFVWLSDRDGFMHLYLYSINGELIRQLTSGEWVVTGFTGFDPGNKKGFFHCTMNSPLSESFYSVDLKNGALTEITSVPGSHHALLSDDAEYLLDTYSSPAVASRTDFITAKGNIVRTVHESPDPLSAYDLGETTVFSIRNTEGNDLYCRLIKPPGFDPGRRYPVFIYVYGGPHSQLVTDTWLHGGTFFMNYVAQQGYLVFTMDNRGTSNRGSAFEKAIFRNVGACELADQMAGVDYLKSLPYVDSTRIGINGWSYGGFMALTMMLRNPGRFAVTVAGGPVTDWKYYEVMYGERYMDTPETNPEGYAASSLLSLAEHVTGKILIIQGYLDETVVPQNALDFLEKCVEKGKQVDFFLYPDHPHNIRGKDRIHLNTMIINYFNQYLHPGSEDKNSE